MADAKFEDWLSEVTEILRKRRGFDIEQAHNALDPDVKQVIDEAYARYADNPREAADIIYLKLGPEEPRPAC